MVTNQIEYSRIEQRSVMKFLMAKKCKPCEIYKMCDADGVTCSSLKMFTDKLNTTSLGKKDSPWIKNKLFGKEKDLCTVVSKEGHADSLLGHKGPITVDFLEKCESEKNACLGKIHLIYWMTIYIYIYIYILLYSLHNGLTLLHKYMSTERQKS